jgi:polyisoprenoid-binding protein YceI
VNAPRALDVESSREVNPMHLRRHLGILAVAMGLAALSTAARAALSDASAGHVSFQASGPAGMKIEGTTGDLTLADKGDSVVITVPLANLSTGITLRDRHMKEKYLEVPKYPSATLSVSRPALKVPAAGEKVEIDVPATVNLHGQTRPVTVHYQAKRDGSTLVANGKFHINMTDFGITVPSYLGVTVKPDVDVSADFRAAGS